MGEGKYGPREHIDIHTPSGGQPSKPFILLLCVLYLLKGILKDVNKQT